MLTILLVILAAAIGFACGAAAMAYVQEALEALAAFLPEINE